MKRKVSKQEIEEFESKYEDVQNWLGNIESPKTRSEYVKHLIRYCESVEKTPKQLIELKQDSTDHKAEKLLNKFVRQAQKSGYPNSMLCSTVIAVKSFYKWNLESLESACGKVSRIKQKPYRTPEKESIKAFLEGSHIRDKALITLIASTGISEGSIPSLKWSHVWEDLIEDRKEIPHIALTSVEIKGGGKGSYQNVEQHTFLTPYASETLLKYKAWIERKMKRKITPNDPMFTTLARPFKKLELITIRAIFIRRSKETGIAFSCHDFRRFVQTELEHARLQPNWIKKILRHKVSGEESPYSRPKIEQLRNAYREAIPYLDLSEQPKTSEVEMEKRLSLRQAKRWMTTQQYEQFEKLVYDAKNTQEIDDAYSIATNGKEKLESLKSHDCQFMISEDQLEGYLTKGFKFVSVLPSGKILVSNE